MSASDPQVVQRRLEEFRRNLLDTSLRNRLINFRTHTKAGKPLEKVVEVRGEDPIELVRLLVAEGKAMSFVGKPDPRPPKDDGLFDDEASMARFRQEAEHEIDTFLVTGAPVVDSTDLKLNSDDTVSALQRKLTKIWRDARVAVEEQGVNVLFLALGSLEWSEEGSEEVRRAPLIMLPVSLERTNAGAFRLRWDGGEPGGNLSIAAKLKAEFGIRLPEMPDELDVARYLDETERAVESRASWSVDRFAVALGFFSYAKYLMYRDLDPLGWPSDGQPKDHATLGALLDGGFEDAERGIDEDAFLDTLRKDACEVYDADASQTLAILEANTGRTMVIEGPPGTGKSQTITNLIAEAVGAGKKVLFVAEKAAALDVVYRRLREANLEDACLELHSHKANKRSLYGELKRTVEVAAPKVGEADLRRLEAAKAALNDYAEGVNAPLEPFGVSPREAMGRLVALGPSDEGRHSFDPMEGWNARDFAERLEAVRRLQAHVARMGRPVDHPFFGSKRDGLLPQDRADLARALDAALRSLEAFQGSANALAEALRVEPPRRPSDIDRLVEYALFVARAPDVAGIAIRSDWESLELTLREAIVQGRRFNDIVGGLAHPEAIDRDVAPVRDLLRLRELVGETEGDFSAALDVAASEAFGLADFSASLARDLGVPAPATLGEMEPLAALAKRAASAPDVRDMAVAAEGWKESAAAVEEALGAVGRHQEARARYEAILTEGAWGAPVRAELETLERHGEGFFRFLNGSYRRAMATSAAYFHAPPPAMDRVAALRAVVEAKEAEATVARGQGRMRALFGERWEGVRSDVATLTEAASWLVEAHLGGEIPRETLLAIERGSVFAGKGEESRARQAAVSRSLESLGREIGRPLPPGAYEFLVGPLRSSLTEIGGIVGAGNFTHAFSMLDRIVEAQGLRARIRGASSVAVPALGSRWDAEGTDWGWAQALLDWVLGLRRAVREGALPEGLVAFFAEGRPRAGLDQACRGAHDERAAAQKAAVRATDLIQIEPLGDGPISTQRERLAQWGERLGDLPEMIRYNALANESGRLGLAQSLGLAESWPMAGERLTEALERGWYDGIVRRAVADRPALARFDRRGHEETAAAFRSLDDLALRANRARVALSHWRSVPRGAAGGAIGWLGVQFNLRIGHKPIRVAMERAGEAIQAIKPVFLMSPLSVAMYLPADGPRFDVVIFDEASQVKPEDAFGAILRADQTIVVGDSKQMPPTSFFDKLVSEEDEEDEVGDSLGDLESVLAMMSAKIPSRSARRRDLRWHYRSRHDALIATSNRLFYGDRLVVFPSPWRGGAHTGLVLRHDPTTVYGRGGTRKNVQEARAVAQAARTHVLEHPSLTLGVAAFSKAQQEAIQDELDALRREEPAFAAFDAAHPFEPLFVKNLENVQGDERDVILISVGYGRDENGAAPANFGPLNREGGERRLNVLITRARLRCEVFSSLKADDIRVTDAAPRGVLALKTFLAFADTGSLDVPPTVGTEEPSGFEKAILERLRTAGYDVEPQVGGGGFYVDLAVRHPERPERFVLGIECDGAMYRRARTSRDRDKLRQAALESRGWRLHRVWSVDWFHHPDREFDRLTEAIAAAVAGTDEDVAEGSARPEEYVELQRDEAPIAQEEAEVYVPYALEIVGAVPIPERPTTTVAGWVAEVVAGEGPIHVDELTRRIREAAGVGQAGARIRAAIEAGIESAGRQGRVERRGEFLYDPTQVAVPVRLRSEAGRRLESVAPEEIAEALARVVRRSFGIARDEAATLAARSLGFERTTAGMMERLRELIQRGIEEGRFVDDGGVLRA